MPRLSRKLLKSLDLQLRESQPRRRRFCRTLGIQRMSGELVKYNKRLGPVKHNFTPANNAADTYFKALRRADRRDL